MSVEKLTIGLKDDLLNVFIGFWRKNKDAGLTKEDMFMINSISISSLMAMITHNMFKKGDRSIRPSLKYLETMATQAQEILTSYRDKLNDDE